MKQEPHSIRNIPVKQQIPDALALMIVFMGIALFSLVLLHN